MAKAKLSRKQAWRIRKIQEERTARSRKRDNRAEQALVEGALGDEQSGLVISHYGNQVDVEGQSTGEITRCHLRANLDSLVTGDRVTWCAGKTTGVVVARDERQSELSRPDFQGTMRPVAANIDLILLVIAPLPVPHASLIDRYLVAAESVAIEPVIVLNKLDLLDEDNRLGIDQLLSIYSKIGYRILDASTQSQHGLEQLKAELKHRTSVFVGQSGVGKSSLINSLLPGVDTRVGALSERHAEGMHTTTTARLFHFPEGGHLIDSPGVREFGLWHMEREQVLQGFIEFRPFLGGCKFRNCQHRKEPGCELLSALARGDISEARFESFEDIANTLSELQDKR